MKSTVCLPHHLCARCWSFMGLRRGKLAVILHQPFNFLFNTPCLIVVVRFWGAWPSDVGRWLSFSWMFRVWRRRHRKSSFEEVNSLFRERFCSTAMEEILKINHEHQCALNPNLGCISIINRIITHLQTNQKRKKNRSEIDSGSLVGIKGLCSTLSQLSFFQTRCQKYRTKCSQKHLKDLKTHDNDF